MDETHCCTRKFNITLSLCGVLGVALYFSKGFLEVAVEGSVATEALYPLEVTIICFLELESNLCFYAL